jgi:hypothetical protein
MKDLLIAQYPALPNDEITDYESAANAVLAEYGEMISIRRGSDERSESPLDSLARVAKGKPVIVLKGDSQ